MILKLAEAEVTFVKVIAKCLSEESPLLPLRDNLPEVEKDWQPQDEIVTDLRELLEAYNSLSNSLLDKMDAQTIRGTLNIDLRGASI